MDRIVVSVGDIKETYQYDFEVNISQTVGECLLDIVESLIEYDQSIQFSGDSVSLFCQRLNRYLPTDISLYDAGVWNGDYLFIMEE